MTPQQIKDLSPDEKSHLNVNSLRANEVALLLTGVNAAEDLTDLLTNIRHYCDATGLSFVRCNNNSRMNHEAEIADCGVASKIWEDA